MLTASIMVLLVTSCLQELHIRHRAIANRLPTDGQVKKSNTSTTEKTKLASTGSPVRNVTPQPWYLKDLSGMRDRFIEANRSVSDFLELEHMVNEIDNVLKVHEYQKPQLYQVGDQFHMYLATSDMADIVSNLSKLFCSQADVIRRISCRDRCGQSPEMRGNPAHCGCDRECFMYGDCCHDMSQVCLEAFVETISRYYAKLGTYPLPRCAFYDEDMLPKLHEFSQVHPSTEPQILDLSCVSKMDKFAAIDNITNAASQSGCGFSINQLTTTRECNKPDVFVCGGATLLPEFGERLQFVIPIHLICYRTTNDLRLMNRYVSGLDDMEIIPIDEDCRHLSMSHDKQHGVNDSKLWPQSHPEKIQLSVFSRAGWSIFIFEGRGLGRLKCVSDERGQDWSCQINECPEGCWIDERTQTCFWPDNAYLDFISADTPETNKNTADDATVAGGNNMSGNISPVGDRNQKEGGITRFDNVCLCLEAQSVMNSVDWAQVIVDTNALVNGRCVLWLVQENAKAENEIDPTKAVAYNNASHGAHETIPHEEASLSATTYMEKLISNLWISRRRQCSENLHTGIVRICFSNKKYSESKTQCFVWQTLGRSNHGLVNIASSARMCQTYLLKLAMFTTSTVWFFSFQ